jgi:hypothetical protein
MKTPAGKECKFYYGDFYRGRSVQACRLIERNSESPPWRPHLCHTCPAPDILRANQSDTLKLDGRVVKKFFGLQQQVEIEGWCSECFNPVPDLMVGCLTCARSGGKPSVFDLEEGEG